MCDHLNVGGFFWTDVGHHHTGERFSLFSLMWPKGTKKGSFAPLIAPHRASCHTMLAQTLPRVLTCERGSHEGFENPPPRTTMGELVKDLRQKCQEFNIVLSTDFFFTACQVNLKVIRIDSVKTQLPFEYYALPFCQVLRITHTHTCTRLGPHTLPYYRWHTQAYTTIEDIP